MKLQPIVQSEVSQREKHQYSILIHIYIEFRKMEDSKRDTDLKKQTFGLCGRRRGWDDLRK